MFKKSDRLTPRKWQSVKLVASGRTNAEIGKELWITENSVKQALKRIFRKLGVSSRAQMVAQVFAKNSRGQGSEDATQTYGSEIRIRN